jgi:hypothetical protein
MTLEREFLVPNYENASGRGYKREATYLGGKLGFVVELLLYPCHQIVYVLWSRALDWFLELDPIAPVILIPLENVKVILSHSNTSKPTLVQQTSPGILEVCKTP